jgi:hypothetical protein
LFFDSRVDSLFVLEYSWFTTSATKCLVIDSVF